MAEDTSPPPSPSQSSPTPLPSYLEVNCKSTGKAWRFAAGTDAGFAVGLINRKLNGGTPVALHIEAVKDGDEPIAFGPNSVLVDFGDGWKLQTVTEADLFSSDGARIGLVQTMATQTPVRGVQGRARRVPKPISFLYIFKIVFAFILIFVLGAIFTLALENLPALILFVKSHM